MNFGLMYDYEPAGFSATVLFNQIGERIYLVGDLTSGAGSPNIWEAPRALFDLQCSKKIMEKRAEIRFSISDLLNSRQYFYQNADNIIRFQKSLDAYRFTRRAGTTYSVSFQFNILQ
jgi:hypothetical protein